MATLNKTQNPLSNTGTKNESGVTGASANILLPQQREHTVSGPVEFAQSNVQKSNSGRIRTNHKLSQIIGHPQADMSKQVARWFPVKTAQWTSTQAPNVVVFSVSSAEMFAAACSFNDVADYYMIKRVSPVLKLTISGNAAQQGKLVVIYVPPGVDPVSETHFTLPSYLSHGFIKPNESTSLEVEGHYVKHARGDSSIHGQSIGTFVGYCMNTLTVPDGTPGTATVKIMVRFADVALYVYKPPTQSCPEATSKKLKQYLSTMSLPEQQAFIRTLGVTTGLEDILKDVMPLVDSIIPLVPLFHSPPMEQDSWAVTDRPQKVVRMQYTHKHVCPPDQTVGQMDSLYQMCDIISLLKLKALHTTVQWSDTQAAGTLLASVNCRPDQHPYFIGGVPGAVSVWAPPAMWRGEITIKIEFIKTVFHKGQVKIQVLPPASLPTDVQSEFGITDYVDISDNETHEMTIPWSYHTDFKYWSDPQVMTVSVSVLNELQTTNATATVGINIWFALGADFQAVGGPSQAPVLESYVTRFTSLDRLEYRDIAKTAGAEDPIETESKATTDSGEEQQTEVKVVEPVPEKSQEMIPTMTTKPEPTVAIFGTTSEKGSGWTPYHESNLKLGAHRRSYVGSVSFQSCEGIQISTKTDTRIFFQASQADLLRIIPMSQLYAYVSGGIRLTVMTTATCLTPAILVCSVTITDTITNNEYRSSRQHQANMSEHRSITFEIPYNQCTPAVPTDYASLKTEVPEINNMISLGVIFDETSAYHDKTTQMHIFLHAADDYAAQVPLPVSTERKLAGTIALLQEYPPALTAVKPADVGTTAGDTPPEEEGPPSVFYPRTSNGLEMIHVKARHVRLLSCDTRIRAHLDILERVVGEKGHMSRRHVAFFRDIDHHKWLHIHTDTHCILEIVPNMVSEVEALNRAERAFNAYDLTHEDELIVVPSFPTTEPLPGNVRVCKREGLVHYYKNVGGRIFRTTTKHYQDRNCVWGAIGATAGIFDSIKNFWTDGPQKTLNKMFKESGKEAIDELTKDMKGRLAASFGYGTKTELETLGNVLLLKALAYGTQFAGACKPVDWVSILLHALGDVQALMRTTNIFGVVIEAIAARVSDFVNLFWNREKGRDRTTPYDPEFGTNVDSGETTGDSDPEDTSVLQEVRNFVAANRWSREEEEVEETFLRKCYNFFKGLGSTIFGMSVGSISLFWRACKATNLLGQGVRGLQACVTGLQTFFTWLGFLTDPVKQRVEEIKAFVSRSDVQLAFAAMPDLLNRNSHSFGDCIEEILAYRAVATQFVVYSKDMRDAGMDDKLKLCELFLRNTAPVANMSSGVKDFEPVFVLIKGAPGLGKTVATTRMARSLMAALGRQPDSYYSTMIEADYWTGYADQPVIVIDDLFQDPKGDKVHFLTQLISSVKTPLPQADVESKGCVSEARIIIATTNAEEIKDTWTLKPDAIWRRCAPTLYQAVEQGKFKRMHYDLPDPKTGLKIGSGQKCIPVSDAMDVIGMTTEVWNYYNKKWTIHEEIKSQPLVDLPLAQGTARAPEQADIIRIPRRPVFTPKKMKVDYKNDAITANDNTWWSKTTEAELFCDTQLYLEPANKGLPQLDWKLRAPASVDYFAFTQHHGLPWLGVPETDDMAPGSPMIFRDLTPDQIRTKLGACTTEQLLKTCRHLWKQGFTDEQISEFLPYKTGLQQFFDNTMKKLHDYKWWLMGAAAFAGVVAAAVVVKRAFLPAEAAATYNPASGRQTLARAQYTRMTPQQKQHIAIPTGAEDKEPLIQRAMVLWTREATTFDSGMTVNGVLLGGGFLLTVAHAVTIGRSHYVRYIDCNGIQVRMPVHVGPNTIATLTPTNGHDIDLVVVYLGACYPNSRDIKNYFLTDDSFETIPTGPARLFYKCKEEIAIIDVEQTYSPTKYVHDTKSDRMWTQSCFSVPFVGRPGCCGSLLMSLDKHRDTRLMGIVNAVSSSETYILPVTKEMLTTMIEIIKSFPANIEVPPQEGDFDKAQLVPVGAQFAGLEVDVPMEPVHIKIENDCTRAQPVNLTTQYEISNTWKMLKNMDPKQGLTNGMKKPGLWARRNNTKPANCLAGEQQLPGDQFYVEQALIDIDGIMSDFAIMAFERKLNGVIPQARLLSEVEILNGYTEYNQGRVIENKGFPRNTAIGLTCQKAGFGTKKKDLLTESMFGPVQLKPEVRDYFKGIEDDLKQGKTHDRTVVLGLKDELRGMGKIVKGQIRLFCIEDSSFVYLATKYFGNFMDQYRSLGFLYWHTLGKDPVRIWNTLAKWMPEVLAGDCKNWDLSLQGPHFEWARVLVELFYQSCPDYKTEDAVVRLQLWRQITLTVTTFAGNLYLSRGMKSGMYCTTEINSIIQTIIVLTAVIRMCVYKKNKSIPEALDIAVMAKFVTNGDDNMHGKPTFCEPEEYVDCILAEFEANGIEYTRADKSAGKPAFQPITEAEYLKRKWVMSDETGEYHPQIAVETISGLLEFHKKTTNSFENFKETLVFARQGRNRILWRKLQIIGYGTFNPDKMAKLTWEWATTQYNAKDHDILTERKHIVFGEEREALCVFREFSVKFCRAVIAGKFRLYPVERKYFARMISQGKVEHNTDYNLCPDVGWAMMCLWCGCYQQKWPTTMAQVVDVLVLAHDTMRYPEIKGEHAPTKARLFRVGLELSQRGTGLANWIKLVSSNIQEDSAEMIVDALTENEIARFELKELLTSYRELSDDDDDELKQFCRGGEWKYPFWKPVEDGEYERKEAERDHATNMAINFDWHGANIVDCFINEFFDRYERETGRDLLDDQAMFEVEYLE